MDLRRAPLLRVLVAAEPGTGRWLALVQTHHLLMDHTGLEVVLEEITALLAGRGEELPEPVPFRNFVAQARLGMAREEHERYFAALVGDVTEPTAPFGLLDVRGDGSRARQGSERVEEGLAGRVREVARGLGVSPATVFHLVWARVLAAVAGRDDVVFGTVLFGRIQAGPGTARVPGPFINTLPVRVRVGAGSVGEAVAGMRDQLAGLLVHEHAPLSVAQRASGVAAPAPLFTSLFNYRHTPGAAPGGGGLGQAAGTGIGMVFSRERSNYPLAVAVNDAGSGFSVSAEAAGLVDPQLVCGLVLTVAGNLVAALAGTPGLPFRAVQVLSEAEREQVVSGWNDTAGEVPAAGGAEELVGVRAGAGPDVVAVACGGVRWSYGWLWERAGRVAGALQRAGVGAEQVVGVCLPRGPELVAVLVGVWRAGAAYLPLDPGYPAGRLAFMVADGGAGVVVCGRGSGAGLPGRVLWAEDLAGEVAGAGGVPAVAGVAGRLAYVIYTSGSTGVPKGVLGVHRGVVNLVAGLGPVLGAGPGVAVLQVASFSFDASVFDLAVVLAGGGTLVMATEAERGDPGLVAGLVRAAGVRAAVWCRRCWGCWTRPGWGGWGRWSRVLSCWAGSWRGRGRRGGGWLIRYGPTEATVMVTAGPVAAGPGGPPPIGGPIVEYPGVRAGRVALPGAGRGGGGVVCGGGGAGAGVCGAGGADGGAVRGVPVRGGGADVPDRGCGEVGRGWGAGVRGAGR